jgi:hypothetical protein
MVAMYGRVVAECMVNGHSHPPPPPIRPSRTTRGIRQEAPSCPHRWREDRSDEELPTLPLASDVTGLGTWNLESNDFALCRKEHMSRPTSWKGFLTQERPTPHCVRSWLLRHWVSMYLALEGNLTRLGTWNLELGIERLCCAGGTHVHINMSRRTHVPKPTNLSCVSTPTSTPTVPKQPP